MTGAPAAVWDDWRRVEDAFDRRPDTPLNPAVAVGVGRRPVRNFAPAAARRARERRGLRQEDVASQLGVSRTNYVLVEQGSRGVGPAMLRRLAAILEVAPHDLTATRRSEATLRDLREWAGLTQADVAEHLGVASAAGYAAIERGRRELPNEVAAILASAFGCSPVVVRRAWNRSAEDQ
jgi:transcriptional regulator with XRE-family HTH domain